MNETLFSNYFIYFLLLVRFLLIFFLSSFSSFLQKKNLFVFFFYVFFIFFFPSLSPSTLLLLWPGSRTTLLSNVNSMAVNSNFQTFRNRTNRSDNVLQDQVSLLLQNRNIFCFSFFLLFVRTQFSHCLIL